MPCIALLIHAGLSYVVGSIQTEWKSRCGNKDMTSTIRIAIHNDTQLVSLQTPATLEANQRHKNKYTILKRPEWLGGVSMDHLLHTSQKINTIFSDVSVGNSYRHQ